MKKIILLLLLSFFSFSSYSQLALEGFESGIPSTWAVFDNGVGTGQSWGINSTVANPPIVYQGVNAAYINRENLVTDGLISEDYLATPLVTIPANGQLRFFTRSFASGNQGTKYQIRVALATATQTNPLAYTLVQEWDETTLNATYNIYEEKVVSLSAYANQQVYVSFVRVHTQLAGGINGAGDRWLVDNVSIVQQCLDPTGLAANGITQTSANLTWGNPSGATSWEIEIVTATGTPTGIGTVYNGTLPYAVTATTAGAAFTPSTAYKYYVRALCGSGASSIWVGSSPFTTASPGLTCAAPITIGTLPYSTIDDTANYGDTTDVSQPAACAAVANNYMTGNDVFYSYTATTTGVINITMTPNGTRSGIFVYDGCSNVGATCVAGVANTGSGVRDIPALSVVAGHQYIIVISTRNVPQTVGYSLVIQAVNCAPPVGLPTTGIATNSANLSWSNPSGATSWEVAVQTAGSAIPSGSGDLAGTNTNFPVTGLTANTAYQYYVRANCGNGTFSAWAGPYTFNTQCGVFNVPFQEGFNSTSTTQSCWTVLNVNNDTDTWNMNYTNNPFEGNEVAAITTDFNTGANDDWLISPQIILNGNQRLKFHYRVQDSTEPNDFRVMLSTTGNAPANFTNTLIPLSTYSNTTYAQKIVSLTGYTGAVNIAWHVPAGGLDGWRLYIDNVIIEDLPTCPEPTALASSNVLSTSATVSWTNGNTESAWQVLALPCGSPAPVGDPTTGLIFNNVTSNPFTLTGLLPATCYDVYVRAFCSSSDSSPWSGPIIFTTQVAPPACGGTFTDPGGSANYTINTDSTVTICPNPGELVTVTFTAFDTEANYDGLYVFDGNSILAPQIASTNGVGNVPGGLAGAYWGTTIPGPFTSSSNDGCLTFRFISDTLFNFSGWAATVTCSPAPNCQKPTNLTATDITSTSALLGWTEPSATVTQWEVLVVPFGSPAPTQSLTGTIVSVNPVLYTGLNPGTQYTFYVRGICPTSGTSAWSSGVNFTTLIINDNCSGAIFAPVNQSSICQQVTPGTINGATATIPAPTAPCVGTADDDVWFQFVASNPFLSVSLQNIVGTTTNLNFAVYSGSCGTLTQVFCSAANTTSAIVNGLTVGQTYFIRVYSNASTPQDVNFNLCISTPASCISGQSACQNLSYQNTTGVDDQGAIGCLFSSPNPAYYTINVLTTGPINLLLTQSTTQGGAPDLDVDYAAWGPFSSQAAACAAMGNPPTLTPGIGVPISLTTGCSYSIEATETLNIANAIAGQVYVILITNYSDDPGYISLTQTNATSPGAGYYECCPDAYFTYNPVTYCKSPGAQNPQAVVSPGSVTGVFSLSPASPSGLVFANTTTGEIDLAASAPGNYLVLNTVAATATCPEKQRGYNISIVEPTTATISYDSATYCKSNTSLQNVTISGSTGGTFAAIPNVGLSINPTNGSINPSLSSPGIYNVVYSLPGTGVCSLGNPITQVEIIGLPNISQPAAVSVCNTYSLPVLNVGNYYSQPGGLGTPLDISVPITSSQIIYVYATNNGCANEKSFSVTINSVTTPILYTTTPSSCTSSTGSITVTSPTSAAGTIPTEIFISEVTDAGSSAPLAYRSLTYVELFNGTGATVNLANYKLKIYNNGSSNLTTNNDLTLSGTMANNTTKVIAIGDANNPGTGVTPYLTFANCSGVNTNDNIRLTTSTNTLIDLWGSIDGTVFTPNGQAGYTYRRNASALHPSTTWNPADWTSINPEDYTNVGAYTLAVSNYQYSVDNGSFQVGTTFSNLAAGSHILTVKDITTNCTASINITIGLLSSATLTSLTATTPICSGGNAVFSLSGSANATVTYSINSGANQTVVLDATGNGTVTVNAVTANTTILLSQISLGGCDILINNTATVVVNSNPTFGNLTATTPVCSGGNAVYSLTGTANATVTYTINSGANQTVVLDATGNGSITINAVSANTTILLSQISLGTCNTNLNNTATVVVNSNPTFGNLVTTTPVCFGGNAVFSLSGAANATVTYSINSGVNQTVVLDAAGNGTVTVNTVTADTTILLSQISLAGCTTTINNTKTVIVNPLPQVTIAGDCVGVAYTLTANPVGSSFDPLNVTYSWEDSSGNPIGGNLQSIVVTNQGEYTVNVTSDGCLGSAIFSADEITCTIQKGISVNNDGKNDTFDLTGFNVKKLTIFNRYGLKVYDKNNYTNEWGGQSNSGDELPDGTYYYVIARNNGENKTGWIYINRAQ